MGKDVEYTAIVQKIREGDHGSNACLVDVKHKGKFIADHIWVSMVIGFPRSALNKQIRFKGVAYTYKDSKGNRKHGLKNCRNYIVDKEDYIDSWKRENENYEKKRKGLK